MNYSLSREYPSVGAGAVRSYGGSQLTADSRTTREAGCGVVAALDLLLYIDGQENGRCRALGKIKAGSYPIALNTYNEALESLRRHYLPLIPRHGINGLMLALGLNSFFLRHHMPYRAFWGVPHVRLWQRIETMLQDDIPVILSVGPNFPFFWQQNRLRFYVRQPDGSFLPGPQTRSHYVTVTGMDERWLQISSWGRKYFILREEYTAYVRQHSARLMSNVLYVRKKDHGDL